jgi:hypothetical protein
MTTINFETHGHRRADAVLRIDALRAGRGACLSLLKYPQGWETLVIFADQPSICREILMKCRES